MCTVLTTVKPCVVARRWRANVKWRKGPRGWAGSGVAVAAGLRVIGAGGGKPDRLGERRCAGDTGVAGVNGGLGGHAPTVSIWWDWVPS